MEDEVTIPRSHCIDPCGECGDMVGKAYTKWAVLRMPVREIPHEVVLGVH